MLFKCIDVSVFQFGAKLFQDKLKEWHDIYKAMKEDMIGRKQKGKQVQNKKGKADNKRKGQSNVKGKRKSEETAEGSDVKKKRDGDMEVEESDESKDRGSGTKRRHGDNDEGNF